MILFKYMLRKIILPKTGECFEVRASLFVPQNLATFSGGWFYSEVVKPLNNYHYGTEKEAI